jgi:hypothetical protein
LETHKEEVIMERIFQNRKAMLVFYPESFPKIAIWLSGIGDEMFSNQI